jgi:hypothetical protein
MLKAQQGLPVLPPWITTVHRPVSAGNRRGDAGRWLSSLQRYYTLLSDDGPIIDALTASPPLYSLLRDAVEPLRHAFGERKSLQLEALESGDEGSILRVGGQIAAQHRETGRADAPV